MSAILKKLQPNKRFVIQLLYNEECTTLLISTYHSTCLLIITSAINHCLNKNIWLFYIYLSIQKPKCC